MKKIYSLIAASSLALFCLSGCGKDFLDKKPTNAVNVIELTATPDKAQEYLNGVYKFNASYAPNELSWHDNSGVVSRIILDDVAGLDVMAPSTWYSGQYLLAQSNRLSNQYRSGTIWAWAYALIKDCNVIITAGAPKEASEAAWTPVLGQAYALRAWSYHQLCGMYQKHYRVGKDSPGFPLVLDPPTADAEKDSKPRGKLDDVYKQMVKDLDAAISRLTVTPRISKGHINLNAAKGILARVYSDMAYLDNSLWPKVELLAQEARAGFPLMEDLEYKEGFNSRDNPEWIWGYMQDKQSNNIANAAFFSYFDQTRSFGYKNMRAATTFVQMFDNADCRKMFSNNGNTDARNRWTISKFKDNSELTGDVVLMRTAEMLLVEAEAKINLGNYTGAETLINELRAKRITGYVNLALPTTKDAALETLWNERRKELYGEGFALRDILRFGWFVNGSKAQRNPADHMGGLGIGTGYTAAQAADNDNRYLFQIPDVEFENNVKLVKPQDQNPLP